jgi:hypothetical protein
MSVFISPVGGVAAQFFDNNGNPLTGGKLYTYAAGTTTPQAAYTTSLGNTAWTNPIVLDAGGRVSSSGEIWLTSGLSYKFVLKNSNDVLIATWDNVSGNGDPAFSFYTPDSASLLAPGPLTVKEALDQITNNDGGSSLIGYLPPFTGSENTTVQAKLAEWVSVKDFGAVGDGVTDDTVAIQDAIDHASTWNKSVFFPEGKYAITQISTNGHTATWYFAEAELLAISNAVSEDCMVKIDAFNSKFYGLKVNLNNKLNYKCAVWWYNDAVASQYNSFFGLTIMQAWRGLVYGEFPGSTSTSLPQSENSIYGFQCYGVWQPLVMNHVNGVLMVSAGQLVSSNDTWGGSFDNTNNFAFVAYAGALTLDSCEVQNSIAALTSYGAIIQGGEVYLNGCITEFDVPFQLSGLLTINGGRVLNTQSATDMFYIGSTAASNSRLKVNDCYIYRNDGAGSFSNKQLVNNTGSADTIQITFSNCDINDWASFVSLTDANNQSVTYDNCRWYPDGTANEFYGVYLLDNRGQNIIDVNTRDTKGYTTDGWYLNNWYGAAPALSLSTDVPNSTYVKSLAVTTAGQAGVFTVDPTSLSTIKATGFRVGQSDKFLVEGWVRFVTGGTDDAYIGLALYDSAGTLLGAPFLAIENAVDAISVSWQYVRGVVTIPSGSTAAYAGFGAWGLTTEVRMCGMKVRRANWNMI